MESSGGERRRSGVCALKCDSVTRDSKDLRNLELGLGKLGGREG